MCISKMIVVDMSFVGLCVFLAAHATPLHLQHVGVLPGVHAAPQNFQAAVVDLDAAAKDTEGIYTADAAQFAEKVGGTADVYYAQANLYKLTLEWDHDATEPLVNRNSAKDKPGWYNPKEDGGVCDHATNWDYLAPEDKLPYWLPRFYPRAVPQEVTDKTGIEFASVDWQPCGHKDIVICHGESHYDFHLYYVPQEELESERYRCDKTKPIHEQIMCMDDDGPNAECTKSDTEECSQAAVNHKYFKLMKDNLPVTVGGKQVDYCMDPTSAIPASGVHYGDKSETLNEWVRPVTITGSHDCKLTFFEPMISWKWIANGAGSGSSGTGKSEQWPSWKSGEIVYNERTLDALPTRWQVKVSEACAAQDLSASKEKCHIQIIVYGQKCDSAAKGGCKGKGARNCAGATATEGGVKNCLTDKIYFTGKLDSASDGALPTPTPTDSDDKIKTSGSNSDGAGSTQTASTTAAGNDSNSSARQRVSGGSSAQLASASLATVLALLSFS